MKIKELSIKDKSKFEILGMGSEGTVYKYHNKAIKIFHDRKSLEKKYRKLILLKSLDFKFIAQPLNFVNIENKLCGYEMELIRNGKNLNSYLNYKSQLDKIKYLKKLENNLKEMHKKHIVVVDCNLHNFLVDGQNIKHIDIDNYKVGNLEANIYPDYYHPYYEEKITNKIDSNIDKFQMTVNALEYLTDQTFYKELLRKYNDRNDYLEYFVKELDIDAYLKEFLLMQVSDSKQKEYLEDKLDLFIR